MHGPAGEQLPAERGARRHRAAGASSSAADDAALAVSEASFREAFDGAPIGIALTTVQDGPEERFLRVNQALAASSAATRRLRGLPVAELTHPEDVALQPDLTASGVGATAAQAVPAPVRARGVGRGHVCDRA